MVFQYLRRFERVVSWELDIQEKHAARIRAVWRPHEGCLPMEELDTEQHGLRESDRVGWR